MNKELSHNLWSDSDLLGRVLAHQSCETVRDEERTFRGSHEYLEPLFQHLPNESHEMLSSVSEVITALARPEEDIWNIAR